MVVEVRFFASLVDRVDGPTETVEIEPGSDVHTLWDALVERHPRLGELPYRPMVACDMVYAEWDRKLQGVREVAFLPPVSGG
jgi:molybdopterin converting factor small subunit